MTDAICNAADLAGELRVIDDPSYVPGGDPDIDGDGQPGTSDILLILEDIYTPVR